MEADKRDTFGSGGRGNMISISDLMQISHPGHRHYISQKNIHDDDLPLFLDYCVTVVERFKHHSEKNFQTSLENKDCIVNIVDLMASLHMTDEPEHVFEIRKKLHKELSNFNYICTVMARCFVSPGFVKEFYENLSKKLNDEITVYAGLEL